MAESQDDKDVDALIAEMQSTLDKLKAAQDKDVKDEDSEEYGESEPKQPPKNLQQAERVAFIRVRAHNRRAKASTPTGGTSGKENSGEPESDDRLK